MASERWLQYGSVQVKIGSGLSGVPHVLRSSGVGCHRLSGQGFLQLRLQYTTLVKLC